MYCLVLYPLSYIKELVWNWILNSTNGIVVVKYVPSKFIPSLLNDFVCSNSNNSLDTIPHLVFSIQIQSNNLTYKGNSYTKYQQFLYTLIKCLQDKGYGYRRIAHKLNTWNVKTSRGNTWFNTSVSSVLKRRRERDIRIQEIRNQEYPIKIGKFAIKYYTYWLISVVESTSS